MSQSPPIITSEDVRHRLRDGQEIALFDLREEHAFAGAHPLFAIPLPIGRIEESIAALVPRRDATIVIYDDGEGRTDHAWRVLAGLGYTAVHVLDGGLEGWRRSGGELFIDVNVPSKAFGELVEHERATPSIAAEDLAARQARGDDLVVLDARRFSEYAVMSIPGGRSLPGGELALRARDVAPSPSTTIVVNCAGRTRSIIGTQSLVNARIPNPVMALRNGTIGWTLAGLDVARGAAERAGPVSEHGAVQARPAAARLAERTGVRLVDQAGLKALQADTTRSLYLLDVRDPEEYEHEHLAGFRSAPGGQLVQATDEWVGVRHGTIVLTDTDGVRARMAGHWLRQLGWREIHVLDQWDDLPRATGPEPQHLAGPVPDVPRLEPSALEKTDLLIDLAPSPAFRRGHIPSAVFGIRGTYEQHPALRNAARIVLTSPDGLTALFATADLRAQGIAAFALSGGTNAWAAAGRTLETGLDDKTALSAPNDVYKRPYEGTDNAHAAMQAYLVWEFGLIAQLEKDGTHGFNVLKAEEQAA